MAGGGTVFRCAEGRVSEQLDGTDVNLIKFIGSTRTVKTLQNISSVAKSITHQHTGRMSIPLGDCASSALHIGPPFARLQGIFFECEPTTPQLLLVWEHGTEADVPVARVGRII